MGIIELLQRRVLLSSVLDPTFGDRGVVTVPPDADSFVSFAPAPGGNVVTLTRTSSSSEDGGSLPPVGRLQLIDESGIVLKDFDLSSDALPNVDLGHVATFPDGSVILYAAVDDSLLFVRFTAGGAVDQTFGNHGATVVTFTGENMQSGRLAVSLDADGTIFAAAIPAHDFDHQKLFTVKLTASGALDTT